MEEVESVVETICTSWINGQKKQAVRQLSQAEDFDSVIDEIAGTHFLGAEDKVRFFAFALKSKD